MFARVALATAIAIFSSSAVAQGAGFKDLRIGTQVANIADLDKRFDCKRGPQMPDMSHLKLTPEQLKMFSMLYGSHTCRLKKGQSETIAGVSALFVGFWTDSNGLIHRINVDFPRANFQEVLQAFEGRYGKPSQIVTRSDGEKLHDWFVEGSTLRLMRVSGDGESALMVSSGVDRQPTPAERSKDL